jgi:hypothetical protein
MYLPLKRVTKSERLHLDNLNPNTSAISKDHLKQTCPQKSPVAGLRQSIKVQTHHNFTFFILTNIRDFQNLSQHPFLITPSKEPVAPHSLQLKLPLKL